MSYIEQTRKEIIEAYVYLRTNNHSIPSETLEFMKDSSLKTLAKALTLAGVSDNEVACCGNCHLPLDNIETIKKTQLADKKYNP